MLLCKSLIASSTASNSNLEGNMSWRASWFKGITGGISCQGSLNRSWLQHLQCKGWSNLYDAEENGFTHQFSLLTILVPSATPRCWYRPVSRFQLSTAWQLFNLNAVFTKICNMVKMSRELTFAWHFSPFHLCLTACQGLGERVL